MRCPRCGYDTPSDRTTCAQCGAALAATTTAGASTSEAATPVWQRPKAPKPTEAPPWSGADNAAPWQTPPEFGVPGRPRKDPSGGDDDVAAGSAAAAAGGPGKPSAKNAAKGQVKGAAKASAMAPGSPPIPAAPQRVPGSPGAPGSGASGSVGGPLPRNLTMLIAGLLGANALAALVYAGFAIVERRSIFARLAEDPMSVTTAAAEGSDAANLVLFLIAGVLTLVAAAALGVWFSRLRQYDSEAAASLGTPWMALAGAGLAAVVSALIMHLGTDTAQLATGYVVLGVGAVLIAAAMAWAAVAVVRRAAGTND